MSATAFSEARDFLLAHREEYERAYRDFRWRVPIFRQLRAHLAPHKRIRRLEFADLPKTISGKIRRVETRTAEAARGGEIRRAEGEFWEEDFPELR